VAPIEAVVAAGTVAGQFDFSKEDPDPDGALEITDLDDELLDIFLEEGGDILDHSDGMLAQLRDNPSDRELVVGLQRDLHTLKGGARMAGLAPIGDLGHAMESLLEMVAEGRRELGRESVEVLERSFDRLHSMVTRVSKRSAIAMPVAMIGRIEALARGEEVVLPSASDSDVESVEVMGAEATASVPTESQEVQAEHPALVSRPTGMDRMAEDEELADVGVRAPQEQIRIRADLLDRLVNYAGEVAIYRARLEQQLGSFRAALVEMDQTTTRLREQLRRLEIETEAQIIARYQREAETTDESFDPLELDRFSTLQQLSRALSESAADLVNLQNTLDDLTRQYETLLLQQSRVSSDLQEGLMRTRMVQFESLVPRLRRIIRQTAGELGKKAQLKVEGAQGEMDRSVLDRMTAPLEHMLRNALAHGLELPEERVKAGKSEEGHVRIAISREASEVVIRVTDDGRGMDRNAIRKKAIERGLLKADAELSDRDLFGFVLETGFSTAESVSKIAGRGVGMDVVNSEIKQLGGQLFIDSERGKGSVFTVRLPFTLAVTQAVLVNMNETMYAVPIASVQGVARIAREELEKQLHTDHPTFEYAGEDYAIYDLGLLLGQAHARADESLQIPLLLARSGDLRAAICVDSVVGSREIVVKPTGPQVSSVPGIFGATIMGDGSVVVILDVTPLVRRSAALKLSGDAPARIAEQVEARRVPLVMVVDDSITMRKVTSRVLERQNYEVLTAKDGVDAIEKLQERVPDVMLLDIEMPRMDGYELATHMRNDARLKGIPIIMITSRTGDKHRQRAFEIGVDRYLGKPYQENELMRNVQEILEVGRGSGG
jgi:chemosensory pili system protein ChpA (sensor histidine kinase/response regulator)